MLIIIVLSNLQHSSNKTYPIKHEFYYLRQ